MHSSNNWVRESQHGFVDNMVTTQLAVIETYLSFVRLNFNSFGRTVGSRGTWDADGNELYRYDTVGLTLDIAGLRYSITFDLLEENGVVSLRLWRIGTTMEVANITTSVDIFFEQIDAVEIPEALS